MRPSKTSLEMQNLVRRFCEDEETRNYFNNFLSEEQIEYSSDMTLTLKVADQVKKYKKKN